MKKIVRLTESELKNIVEQSVRRAITEGAVNEYGWKDFRNDALMAGGLGAAGLATVGGNAYLHDDEPEVNPEQQEINQAVTDEFGSPQGKLPADTIGWKEANGYYEGKIARAVTESINNLMNEGLSETSDDTVASAINASNAKVRSAEEKYGRNSYVAAHARKQQERFNNEYQNRWNAANDAKKARMQKNRTDLNNGERTYVNGTGWRTAKS